MSIAIIIPTLNEAKNLKALLPYLRSNSNQTADIIVVDASDSQSEIEKLCRQHDVNLISTSTASRSKQMNLGANAANSDVLMFLHADVFPPTNFQELIEGTLTEKVSAGLFSYNLAPSSLMLKINSWCTQFDNILTGGGDQCLFLTGQAFNCLGGYDESMRIMEDFEFFNRIKNSGFEYKLINQAAQVSSRKYLTNSWLRVNLVNLMMMLKFRKGATQSELLNFYSKHLKR